MKSKISTDFGNEPPMKGNCGVLWQGHFQGQFQQTLGLSLKNRHLVTLYYGEMKQKARAWLSSGHLVGWFGPIALWLNMLEMRETASPMVVKLLSNQQQLAQIVSMERHTRLDCSDSCPACLIMVCYTWEISLWCSRHTSRHLDGDSKSISLIEADEIQTVYNR